MPIDRTMKKGRTAHLVFMLIYRLQTIEFQNCRICHVTNKLIHLYKYTPPTPTYVHNRL